MTPDELTPRPYGNLSYTGGIEGLRTNAQLCADAFLSDHGWLMPERQHEIYLGPNVSSIARLWPARYRRNASYYCDALFDLIDELAKQRRKIRIIIIGIDGLSTNVASLVGLLDDYPSWDASLTTVLGPSWTFNLASPLLRYTENAGTTHLLYFTTSLQSIGTQQDSTKAWFSELDSLNKKKTGGGNRSAPTYRTI